MKWYLTTLVYQIISGNGDHTPQFDEQIRLVEAENDEQALAKADTMGKNYEDNFMNQQQQLVQWKYISVSAIRRFQHFIDGAELFSQVKEVSNAESYIRYIKQKNDMVKARFSNSLLNFHS